MSDLSKNASRRIRRAKMLKTNLPTWWPLLQGAIGVVLVIGLVVTIGKDSDRSPASSPPATWAEDDSPSTGPTGPTDSPAPVAPDTTDVQPVDTVPETSTPDVTVPADTTTPLPASDTVVLPLISGGVVEVPAAAFERAQAVTVAAYGDTAVIASSTVTFTGEGQVAFSFQVDLDGTGPVGLTPVAVLATFAGGVWTGSL
jgi:hypothetical protein